MEKDCLFCKLKENSVYETENLFVLVDRYPFSNKHLLFISKNHTKYFHTASVELVKEIIEEMHKIAIKLNLESYNILNNNKNGQLIEHLHFHLIEANETGCFNSSNTTLSLNDEEYNNLVIELRTLLN